MRSLSHFQTGIWLLSLAWSCAPSIFAGADQVTLALPESRLQSLQPDAFSTFEHASFPRHSLRIKKSDFCDRTVNVYTGYLDVKSGGLKHLFFHFFESRNNPSSDPIVMWINGGPGSSSAMGLLMELGPCNIELEGNSTTWNPYGWNDKANIFFLDQPVGVGYSYSDDPSNRVYSTPEAAKDVDAFIRVFFETFSQYKGRAFHMAGESYGGRYLPVFASEIVDGNTKAKQNGLEPINLQSVMIGNGLTSQHERLYSGPKMLCTSASGYPPVASIQQCVEMYTRLPYCRRMYTEACLDHFDVIQCKTASDFCAQWRDGTLQDLGLNVFDIRKKCDPEGGETCYRETAKIEALLDNNATRRQLGVDDAAGPYRSASLAVEADFDQDRLVESSHYLEQLLERGIKALLYVGMTDSACSWVGNLNTVNELEWSGGEGFASLPMEDWFANGNGQVSAPDGSIKAQGGLTFVTIKDAGHLVPHDKPEVALAMVNAWLADEF